jgi:hypothetical protein
LEDKRIITLFEQYSEFQFYNKMSGVTSIFNPLSLADGGEALLFYPENNQLALEVRSLVNGAFTPFINRGNEKGFVKASTKLAVAISNRVVGICFDTIISLIATDYSLWDFNSPD